MSNSGIAILEEHYIYEKVWVVGRVGGGQWVVGTLSTSTCWCESRAAPPARSGSSTKRVPMQFARHSHSASSAQCPPVCCSALQRFTVCDAFGPSVHLVACAALLAFMQHARLAPAPCSLDTQSSSSSDWDAVPRGGGWPRLARSVERTVLRHDCLGTRSATAARRTAPGSAGRPTVGCKLRERAAAP